MYVLGLRSRMDISSGMVGTRSAVSYFSLATDIQYKPPLGSKRPGFFPNLRQMRSLLDELERAGLAKRYSLVTKDEKKLAVLLCLATRAQPRPLDDRQMSVTHDRQQQSGVGYGFQGSDRHAPPGDERQISEVQSTSITHSSSSTTAVKENGSKDEDESVMPDCPQKPTQWIRVMNSLGFKDSALSAGALPIYDRWIKSGMQVKQVQAAAAVAAKHGGRSVQYVEKVLLQAQQQSRKLDGAAFEETPGKPWFLSGAGIEQRGVQHGITKLDDENAHEYNMRVFRAAQLSEAEMRLALRDSPFQGR